MEHPAGLIVASYREATREAETNNGID